MEKARSKKGNEFATFYKELTNDGTKFYEYSHMSENSFNVLESSLKKRNNHWRKAITPR